MFLLMYNLKFSESASKKFARPPKFAQNPNGGSYVAPLMQFFQDEMYESEIILQIRQMINRMATGNKTDELVARNHIEISDFLKDGKLVAPNIFVSGIGEKTLALLQILQKLRLVVCDSK